MKLRYKTLAPLVALALTSAAMAQQEPKDSPIDTERPDFTNSPITLTTGKFQLEAGFTYSRGGGVKAWSGPEALLRYGFKPSWELQLGLPNYTSFRDDNGTTSGLGDTFLSVKHQWTQEGAPIDFGTALYATAPTGKEGFTSNAWDGGILFLAQGDLGHKWGLATMLQLDRVTQDGVRNQQALVSASLGYELNEKTQPFFELAALSQRYGGQQAFFQTGVVYRTDSTHQWDIHAAVRIDKNQSFSNIGAGYSVRF